MRKRVFYNPVINDRATLLKSAEETGGEYTLFKIEVAQSFPTGFLTLIIPVFSFIASFAKRTEAALVKKYC